VVLNVAMGSDTNPTSAVAQQLRSAPGLLALQRLPRIGPQTALRTAVALNFDRLSPELIDAWHGELEAASQEIERYSAAGVHLVAFFDERYPARLRNIHQPPPLLFVHGSIEALNESRCVAVIGTREPTSFGVSAAEEITRRLADANWIVVSGLAKGIDTIAHGAALKHHARTVAVMGGGLDRVYPAENRELAAAIVDRGGALVSEQPFGARPHAGSLVARNRLQSGLSAAVVVAQTGVRGGSMHTARHAARQGRPIFAPVPHSGHEQSEGLRLLLTLPARDLCGRVPAWKDAAALCARLGDHPLAHPIAKGELNGFLDALEMILEAPEATPARRWWPAQMSPDANSSLIPSDADRTPALAFVD
jgi:DNA processing protein